MNNALELKLKTIADKHVQSCHYYTRKSEQETFGTGDESYKNTLEWREFWIALADFYMGRACRIDDMINHLKETGFDLNYVDDYPTNKPDDKELVENVHTLNKR